MSSSNPKNSIFTMPTSSAFAPPAWVLTLLLRPPLAKTHSSQRPSRRTANTAMRDLVAQWLVHVTEEKRRCAPALQDKSVPVFAMFRGWLALVFRLPTRLVTSRPEKPKLIKRVNDITILKGAAAQTAFLEKSLYFSSTLQKDKELQARKGGKKKNPQISNGAADEREKRRTDTSKKRGKRANEVIKAQANLSPLYESLYFSISAKEDHLLENMYEPVVPRRENCSKDGLCVMPFFLTEDNAEGRGMLERLREMQTQSREKESGPLAWVPALVSFALIALNPLK